MHVYDPHCLPCCASVGDEHGCCSSSTRSRPGSAAPGRSSPPSTPASPPTSCASARRSRAATSPWPRPLHGRGRRGVSASESGVLMHGPTSWPTRSPVRSPWPTSTCCRRRLADEVARIEAGLRDRPGAGARLPEVADVRILGAVGVVAARPAGRRRDGHRGGARRAASGCGRSATSSTRCRRTSAPTRTSPRICAAHRGRGGGRMSLGRLARRAGGSTAPTARAGWTAPRCAPRAADADRHRPRRQRLPRAVPAPRVVAAAAAGGRDGGAPAPGPPGWSPAPSTARRPRGGARGVRRQPAALVFSTGYHANLAAVTALADPDTPDRLRRPRARLADRRLPAVAGAAVAVVAAQRRRRGRRALAGAAEPRALVLVESVYSVLGDAAPLAELAAVCAAHDAAAGRRRGARARCGRRRRPRAASPAPASPDAPTSWSPRRCRRRSAAQGGAVLGRRRSSSTWSTPPGRSSTTPAWRQRPRPAPRSSALATSSDESPDLPRADARRSPAAGRAPRRRRARRRGAVGADGRPRARRWQPRRPRRRRASASAASGRRRCPTARRGCGSPARATLTDAEVDAACRLAGWPRPCAARR